MERSRFLKLLFASPLLFSAMKLKDLHSITTGFQQTEKMPALFLGHGSPMNAIEENEFVAGFRSCRKRHSKT
jgi:4,5-DOPA dioxygenase extradiol